MSLLILACSSTPQPIVKTEPVKVEVEAPPAFIAPPGKVELRGFLSLYSGSGRFQNCEGETLYWFDNGEEIAALYNSMVQKQGEQVYIEFTGNFSKTPQEFADEFIAQTHVLKLHHMSKLRNSLACKRQLPNNVTAFGLNDEWQADIGTKQINFKSYDENWSRSIHSSSMELGGVRIWKTQTPQGNSISLKVLEQPCIHTRTQAYWSYSSEYYSGKKAKGCADINKIVKEGDFLGHYSGQLPMGDKKVEFNFSLLPDFSAKADFVFSKENKPLSQIGFWQAISETQLLLSLVDKSKPEYSNQFLFNWAPDKLSTAQQGLNGIAKQIPGGLNMWLMDTAYVHGALAVEKRTFIPQNISYNTNKNPAVEAALLNYFKMHRTAPNGMKYNYNFFDLNADGKEDLLIQLNWCNKAGCTLLIFENMGENYRFVSRTTEVHNSLLLASGVDHDWQQLLARRGKEYILLKFDGIGYPSSSASQAISPRPLALAGVTLFSAPEPVHWHHALPK